MWSTTALPMPRRWAGASLHKIWPVRTTIVTPTTQSRHQVCTHLRSNAPIQCRSSYHVSPSPIGRCESSRPTVHVSGSSTASFVVALPPRLSRRLGTCDVCLLPCRGESGVCIQTRRQAKWASGHVCACLHRRLRERLAMPGCLSCRDCLQILQDRGRLDGDAQSPAQPRLSCRYDASISCSGQAWFSSRPPVAHDQSRPSSPPANTAFIAVRQGQPS